MAYTLPTFVNGSTPALSAANLNLYTTAISDVDTRVTGTTTGAINVKASPYNAAGNGSTDDAAAIQAALTAAGALNGGNGGVVIMPPGIYQTSAKLTVPNKVILRGSGRSSTRIRATSGFTTNSYVVQLGPTASLSFSSRVEHLTIDANSVVNSSCLYTDQGQEMVGASYVTCTAFLKYGMHFGTASANWNVDNVELYPAAAGATYGLYQDNSAGSNLIHRVTVGVSGLLTVGLYLKGDFAGVAIHCENCTDGILVDGGSGMLANVTAGTVTLNITNLIRIAAAQHLTIQGVKRYAGATNIVKDDVAVKTFTDSYIESMAVGTSYMSQLSHYGTLAGFFNTTATTKKTVTGSRGGNAALASLLTQLAAYGLITDSSSA